MNTAIGSKTLKTPTASKRHYLLALCVIALSAAAIAGAAVLGTGGSPIVPPVEVPPSRFDLPPPVQLTIYLVDTEEEFSAVVAAGNEALNEQFDSGYDAWNFKVLMAGTESDEAIALANIADTRARWEEQGMGDRIQVVDQRLPR